MVQMPTQVWGHWTLAHFTWLSWLQSFSYPLPGSTLPGSHFRNIISITSLSSRKPGVSLPPTLWKPDSCPFRVPVASTLSSGWLTFFCPSGQSNQAAHFAVSGHRLAIFGPLIMLLFLILYFLPKAAQSPPLPFVSHWMPQSRIPTKELGPRLSLQPQFVPLPFHCSAQPHWPSFHHNFLLLWALGSYFPPPHYLEQLSPKSVTAGSFSSFRPQFVCQPLGEAGVSDLLLHKPQVTFLMPDFIFFMALTMHSSYACT